MKIAEIKEALNNNPSDKLLAELEQDGRSGVQKLLAAYYKKQQAEAAERERFAKMLLYEKQCYESGAQYVAGVDEAGRGPIAGPMVIGAVILPSDVFIKGLNDSKKLTAAKREQLYDEILAKALAVSVNIVSVYNIDRLNIYRATQEGKGAGGIGKHRQRVQHRPPEHLPCHAGGHGTSAWKLKNPPAGGAD